MSEPPQDNTQGTKILRREWLTILAFIHAFRHDVLARKAWLKIRWWVGIHAFLILLFAILSVLPLLANIDLFELLSVELLIVGFICAYSLMPFLLVAIIAQVGWKLSGVCWMESYGKDTSLRLIPRSYEEQYNAAMGPVMVALTIILAPMYVASLAWWGRAAMEFRHIFTLQEQGAAIEVWAIISMVASYFVCHVMVIIAMNLATLVMARRRFLQLDRHPRFTTRWSVSAPLVWSVVTIVGIMCFSCSMPMGFVSGIHFELSLALKSWVVAIVLILLNCKLYTLSMGEAKLAREYLFKAEE
ncbi:MAG: hypothetical protein JJU11_14365 [Candidatus Sumerlaeia bacterium]|nr:hypothetical protein [Candidatus Sumerlaeia bacterium]